MFGSTLQLNARWYHMSIIYDFLIKTENWIKVQMTGTVAAARCSIKLYRMEKIFNTKISQNQANQLWIVIFCIALAFTMYTYTWYTGE